VVDDVLEDNDSGGVLQQHLRREERGPVHRSQRPAMEMEPGHCLDDLVLSEVDGHALGFGLFNQV
jgi:hypothetical protein